MSTELDVLVVGGGVVGGALALALQQERLRVGVVEPRAPEQAPSDAIDPRVFAVSPASAAVLQRLGVWPQVLARRASAYTRMRVWEQGGQDELAFDADLIGQTQLGWIVEDRVLRAAVWSALQAQPAILRCCPSRVIESRDLGAAIEARLDDGRCLRARLIVAADGAESPLREAAGIALDAAAYGERAVVAHVATQHPHEATAWQRFTPAGTLALLPLDDGRSSVVWSLKDARATRVLSLDDAGFCAEIERALDLRLGRITATTPRLAFPLRRQLAQRYAGRRLALVGDAAHVFHPLAGQGLNLGLLDVAALSQLLGEAQARREDPGDDPLLASYDAWRRGDVARAAKAFEWLDGLFRSNTGPLPWLRRTGMGVVQRLGPLKREFALHASGFAGRIPALARPL